jgi:hypothetical protein
MKCIQCDEGEIYSDVCGQYCANCDFDTRSPLPR